MKAIEQSANNAAVNAFSHITDRAHTTCGCVDNVKLVAQAKATSLEDLDCVRDGEDLLDCVPYDMVESGTTPWSVDSIGTPGSLVATQHEGKVFFGWTDYSECESQFHFTRDSQSFVNDFAFTGSQRCGEAVKPEALYDDLILAAGAGDGGRAVGITHKYCVQAGSVIGPGAMSYRSGMSCTKDFAVAYNTRIDGHVLTKDARLPVEGATVTYTVQSTKAMGTTTSAKDGSFYFHILDTKAAAQIEDIDITFSKTTKSTTGPSDHLFICNGELCGPGTDNTTGKPYPPAVQTLRLSHLTFDNKLEILEASSIPFTGTVSFPAMPPHLLPRGADKPDSDAWPWTAQATGSARQCFIPEAEVCLLDHMRSDAAIVCAKTDPQGNFKLPAPVGLHVAVAIKYRSHEAFYRTASSTLDDVSANIDGKKRQHYVTTSKKATGGFGKASSIEVYHITEESDGLWVGMHFQDKTTRRAQLGAHGTLCKLPLGDAAVFNLQHAGGECYSNIAATRIDTQLHTDAEFLVPAHVFDVTFDKVVPAYPQVTDRSKVGYFHRLRNQTQRIDLLDDQATESSSSSSSSGNAAAIFTFHPKPILGIRFKDLQTKLVVAGAGCANATVSADGNEADLLTDSQVPAWKFRAGQQVQAVVDVKAVLANGLGGCTHVEGNIQVHSRLGLSSEDQADLNKDKATADYVAIAKVLTRSIGSPSLVAGLSMCSSPLDSRCTLPLDHEVTTRVKVFGDETECLVTLDGRRANGYVAITAEDQCREQFARVASQSVSAATRAGKRVEHRQWHTLVWNSATEPSLTDAERTAWAALGAGAASWENATSWTSWKDFNDAVFGNGPASQAKTWTAMTAAHRNIASSVLGFSENSWGRTWLLKERIAHNNVELLDWVELRADERTHLAALGWMQSSWEAKQPVSSSPQSALKPWASLTAAMQRSASQLGFTQITWLPAQTDSQTVRGCFWDHATASLVFSRWSDERNASATPRFSAFCMQQEKRLAHVVKDLVVGMPDRLPPFSRTISAIMRQQGYPRTEETTSAVITGKRFKQDLERVPFPEGRPLLTLHDPPGGSSFAYYENARLETEFSKESNLVTTGHESESELAVGVRLEGIGATKLSTEICVGLGASVCQGVEATMMGGGKFGIDALGKLDTVDHSTSGTASDETLQSKLSLTFSYSTSADVEKAGPESDAFLMPALTVEISEVLVVRMSNDAGSCAITGTIDKSWTVLGHLSAFWWITANDVEARVLPALDDLVAAGRFKQQCLAAPSAANCCDQYDAEVPGATACRMGGAVNGALVDSLHKYCSNRLQATSGQDYDNCMEVSEEQLNQVKEANKNWVGTLDRYYQPLKDIKAANEEGTTGLDDLCERASICKHTGLAPKSLIDAAQASNGDALDSEKKDEYREYNTISFVGGGSSMDHKYMLRSSATTKEVLNNDGNTEISRRGGGGAWVEARTPWAGFGGSAKTMHTGGTATIRTSSTVAAASDDSEAGFHLEDPDYGDYFVVQVFKDPVYGTPLFFTNGGASSCHHEQGTAERSSPSLEWKYVGPDNLKPDQPAIFKVTIANELGYYEGGVRGNVSRPFWSNDETGYVAPDMQLYVMPESLVDGIQLKVDGKPFLDSITFLEFGQKKHAMIVEVFRGPSAFTYTAPLIGWKEKCSGGHNTYGHTNVDTATGLNFYSLSMPTPETPSGVHDTAKAIRYMQPCSEVAWSGDILRDGAFLITGSGDTAMKFAVANPGLRSWDNDDRLQKLVMEYRRHECIGHTCWRDSGVALAHAGASFVTGQWQPPATDNEYDIRVTAQCKPSGNPDYDTASTPIVNGVVDREAPMVLSSHLDQLVGAQDVVVVEFSEPIECTPLFEMSFEYENLPAAPSTARDRTVVLSKSQGQITVSCKGSRIIASRPVDRGSDVVAGRTPTLRIAGVEDLAGNVPDPTALVIELVEGEAQRERKEIEADIVRVSAEASNQLAQVSAQSARRQTDLAAAVNKLLKRYGIRTTTNSTTSAAAAAAVEGAAKAMQQAEKDFVEAYTEQKDAEAEVIKAQQALETAKANGDAVVVAEGKEKLLASQNALALKRSAVVAASETKVKAKAAEAAAKSASAAASVAEASAAADAAAPSPSKDDDDDIKTLVIAVLIILVILVLVVLVVVKIAIDATAQKADNVNESRSSHFSAGLSTVRMGPGSDEYLAEASQTSGPHAQGGGVVTTVRGTDYFLASGGVSDMPVRNVSDMLADEVGVSQGGGGIPGARSDRSDASGEYLSTRQALVGADGPSFLDAVPELPAKARSLRVHSSFHSTRSVPNWGE